MMNAPRFDLTVVCVSNLAAPSGAQGSDEVSVPLRGVIRWYVPCMGRARYRERRRAAGHFRATSARSCR